MICRGLRPGQPVAARRQSARRAREPACHHASAADHGGGRHASHICCRITGAMVRVARAVSSRGVRCSCGRPCCGGPARRVAAWESCWWRSSPTGVRGRAG